jgi:alpha-L-fucosidase 2
MQGRRHERRLFVSRADDVIALTVNGWEPGALQMACRLRPHRTEEVTDYGSGRRPQPETPPIIWEARQGSGWHAHIGRYEDGTEFGAVLKSVSLGGGSTYDDQYWGGAWTGVQDAESALFLVKCWHGEPADTAIPRLLEEIAALPTDYETLLQRHLKIHEPLVNAFSLDLGAEEADRSKPNNVLVQEAFEGDVPTHWSNAWWPASAICWFGGSRRFWPANLQGRWNGDYKPAWASDYHNDINIQMTYWPAPQTGWRIYRTAGGLLLSVSRRLPPQCPTAIWLPGILLPSSWATHGQMRHGDFVHWTAGAGWMAQHWWEHWLVTGDREFLRTAPCPGCRKPPLLLDFVEVRDGVAHFLHPFPGESPIGKPNTVADATMDVRFAAKCFPICWKRCEYSKKPMTGRRYRQLLAALPIIRSMPRVVCANGCTRIC